MEHIVVVRANITHYCRDLTRRTLHAEESITGFYYLRVWLGERQKEKQRERKFVVVQTSVKGKTTDKRNIRISVELEVSGQQRNKSVFRPRMVYVKLWRIQTPSIFLFHSLVR